MRPLRFSSRFKTGNAETDKRNREFIDCLNSLITAAGKREHCQEMEDFIGRYSDQAEAFLHSQPADSDLGTEFGRQLVKGLPLDNYGKTACRECGLCDLAQQKIAEHLAPAAECLFKPS